MRFLILFLRQWLSQSPLFPLDRAFSRWFRDHKPGIDQKRLWELLKGALRRAHLWMGTDLWQGIDSTDLWALRAMGSLGALETVPEASFLKPGLFFPPWWRPLWESRQQAAPSELRTRLESPEAHHFVRVTQEDKISEAQEQWKAAGLRAEVALPGTDLPAGWGIQLTGNKSATSLPGYKEGLWESQDLGSQLAAARLPVFPGQRILDLCAGEGGKTMALGARLGGRGALWALDIHEHKLQSLKKRAAKAGLPQVRIQLWTGTDLPTWGPEIQKRGGFDGVLVDAPCTASGTWNRDPEALFRMFPQDLQELTQLQKGLLEKGWTAVRSGGHLLYVTCSWTREENEAQVEAFVQRHPEAKNLGEQWYLHPGSSVFYTCLFQKA